MSTRFMNHLEVRVADNDHKRELLNDFSYLSDVLDGIIVIPKGFLTDFASVPKILWNILPPFGKHTKAAVVHDFLYENGDCTREQADAVFLEAMEDLGVGYIQRYTMWIGVRTGGWVGWNTYRKKKKPK